MKKFLNELYRGLNTTPDGKFSHTKFWSNVANAVASFIMIKLTYTGALTENYFVIYLGVVASHTAVSKLIGVIQPKKGSTSE